MHGEFEGQWTDLPEAIRLITPQNIQNQSVTSDEIIVEGISDCDPNSLGPSDPDEYYIYVQQ